MRLTLVLFCLLPFDVLSTSMKLNRARYNSVSSFGGSVGASWALHGGRRAWVICQALFDAQSDTTRCEGVGSVLFWAMA